MNATNMVQGNLALKLETPAEPTFTVVQGGRSGFQPLACLLYTSDAADE